jgi:hypothetical protein
MGRWLLLILRTWPHALRTGEVAQVCFENLQWRYHYHCQSIKPALLIPAKRGFVRDMVRRGGLCLSHQHTMLSMDVNLFAVTTSSRNTIRHFLQLSWYKDNEYCLGFPFPVPPLFGLRVLRLRDPRQLRRKSRKSGLSTVLLCWCA